VPFPPRSTAASSSVSVSEKPPSANSRAARVTGSADDVYAALRAGWADFKAAPRFGLFFGGLFTGKHKETWPADAPRSERDPATVMVTAEPVTYRPVQRTIQAVGTLHGFEEVSIAARVEGRVRKLWITHCPVDSDIPALSCETAGRTARVVRPWWRIARAG